jgi:transposase
MESTGAYWKPVYNILEDHFALVVANAHDVKIVPGRKSDTRDAEWIAGLLRHGLLRPSFIPSRDERGPREPTRCRQSLVGERSAEVNRIQKVLAGANLKLSSVATNAAGQSGMAVLQGIVAGILDSAALARLTNGRPHATPGEIEKALLGRESLPAPTSASCSNSRSAMLPNSTPSLPRWVRR